MKKLYTLMVCLLATSTLFAQKLPFQGRLLDDGKPYNGTATIEFSISDPAWSETKNNVSVTDGYYSVVLGETTPLPVALFDGSSEIPLEITINGEALSAVTLHSPLLPFTGSNPVSIDSLVAVEISIVGNNGDNKAAFGTTNDGYEGVIVLRDSLNNTGAFMQTDGVESTGYMRGYFQLNGRNTAGELRSAVASGGGVQGRANSFMDLYGGNSADDGVQLLVDVYAADIDLNGPIADGYRRGGIDINNYFGNPTHNIFSEHIGTSTISHMNLNASVDSGGPVFTANINSGDAATTGASLSLTNWDGGSGIYMDATDGGTIDLNAGNIFLNGVNGDISANGQIFGNTLASSDGSVQTSDRRLKKNIKDLDNPLAKTILMRGVSYQWKDMDKSQRNQIGVIAQEVEEIYPEFVHTDDKGMKAVNYAQMTAVLIEALKELNDKVKNLEEENSSLKASLSEVEILRKEMDQLMKMLGNSKAASK